MSWRSCWDVSYIAGDIADVVIVDQLWCDRQRDELSSFVEVFLLVAQLPKGKRRRFVTCQHLVQKIQQNEQASLHVNGCMFGVYVHH